jgi:hypothetical protein
VRWPRHRTHLLIICRALIRIFYHQRYRRSQRFAVLDAGQDGHPVRFFSGGRQFALGRPPPIQLGLNIGFVQGHLGRTAVNHGADALTVGLSKSGDLK